MQPNRAIFLAAPFCLPSASVKPVRPGNFLLCLISACHVRLSHPEEGKALTVSHVYPDSATSESRVYHSSVTCLLICRHCSYLESLRSMKWNPAFHLSLGDSPGVLPLRTMSKFIHPKQRADRLSSPSTTT